MYEKTIDTGSQAWMPLDFPGVSMKILRQDPNGGMTVLTRIEPGAVIPEHKHTHADETVFVCEGDFIEDGISHSAGTFFADPKGHFHGPHSTANGCTVLTTFSAELDFILED